jgi:hypothetical protein
MAATIASSPLLSLDYAAICDPATFVGLDLLPALTSTSASPGFLLAVSACAGSVRLTDNFQFTRDNYWLI